MAKAISSSAINLFSFRKSALTLVSALFLYSPLGHGGCFEAILGGSSPISEKIYRESVGLAQLAHFATPEEVLAYVSEGRADLFAMLTTELGIKRIRFGKRFQIKRDLLIIKAPSFGKQTKQQYMLDFMPALFQAKQRMLRFAGPARYMTELTAFGAKLQQLTGVEGKPAFNYLTYGLRSFFGFAPAWRLWPTHNPRLAFHWTLTRTFAAIYIAVIGSVAMEIPQHIELIESAIRMQGVLATIGPRLEEGIVIDGQKVRLELIEIYQAKIEELERQLENDPPGDLDALRARIEKFERWITEIEAELAKT